MFNTQMLADMRQQNIKEVNADDLVDIRTVSVDTSLPPEQRMMNYLEQVKKRMCGLPPRQKRFICFPASSAVGIVAGA